MDFPYLWSCILWEPSVAQPPLPLQEFLPLQPASLVLQPPWPLQSFWPLHACLPFSASAMVCVETPAWPDVLAAYARAASDPLKRPAIAAPAITAFEGLIIYQLSLYGFCFLFFVMVAANRIRSCT